MTAYPLPTNASQNITGLYTLFRYLNNDVSGGALMLSLMLAFFVIIFIAIKASNSNSKTSVAFVSAAFFNMIQAVIYAVLGFIQNKWMYLSILLVAIGAVWAYIDNKSSGV